MELNKVLLIGNLTRDPETRAVGTGQVCKMGLASNRRYTSQGEKKEEVLFVDVEAWGKTAELCGQYLSKGAQVLVEGRLKMDQWETQQGEKRTKCVVVAERVQFGPRGGTRQDNAAGSDAPGSSDPDTEDDDLPF